MEVGGWQERGFRWRRGWYVHQSKCHLAGVEMFYHTLRLCHRLVCGVKIQWQAQKAALSQHSIKARGP